VRNACKHAEASRIDVRVSDSPDCTELVVEDDGRGLPANADADDAPQGHFGLRILSDLTAAAGAALEIDSGPGAGTRVRVRIVRP
jgi:nitrate/nitrite-specific signal transduction histidine kinase